MTPDEWRACVDLGAPFFAVGRVGSMVPEWGANEEGRSLGLANGLVFCWILVGAIGIEPTTPTVSR
jgi:hypothetical protein